MTKAKTAPPSPTAPAHLAPETRDWWESVVAEYVLEGHHIKILTLAATTWDRCEDARSALAEHGAVFLDRYKQPKARPEVAIERDARIGFVRLMRELALDVEPPKESRPPTLPGRRE